MILMDYPAGHLSCTGFSIITKSVYVTIFTDDQNT